jgi:LacI family transcriptional regulator
LTTISDVARVAGVSKSTVSRVLNDHAQVDPVMAERVRATVASLGYRPSRLAQALRTQQSRVWALLISDVRNAFYTDMVRGIEDLAYSKGYSVVLCNTDEEVKKEAAYLELALAERVGGIVLAPARPHAAHLSKVLASGTPIVTVNGRLDRYDVDRVLTNNAWGAEQVALHLIEGGYERPACITGPSGTTTGRERLAGFVKGMTARGRQLDPELVRHGDYQEASGFAEMNALLALRKPPDAVFVANNQMTLGALEAIEQARLAIPDDIAVVGFDDLPWAPLLKPPLTTVAQPTHDLGLETARLLLSRVEGYTGRAREVVLSPELKIRASSVPRGGTRAMASKPPPAAARG